MAKCKWLKPALGRNAGAVEENEDWLIDKWVASGYVEKVKDSTPSQRFEGEHPEEKAVHAPPVDKAIKESPKKR